MRNEAICPGAARGFQIADFRFQMANCQSPTANHRLRKKKGEHGNYETKPMDGQPFVHKGDATGWAPQRRDRHAEEEEPRMNTNSKTASGPGEILRNEAIWKWDAELYVPGAKVTWLIGDGRQPREGILQNEAIRPRAVRGFQIAEFRFLIADGQPPIQRWQEGWFFL